jgi:hypothetical protein
MEAEGNKVMVEAVKRQRIYGIVREIRFEFLEIRMAWQQSKQLFRWISI